MTRLLEEANITSAILIELAVHLEHTTTVHASHLVGNERIRQELLRLVGIGVTVNYELDSTH
jgi:hypothetical protein